MEVCFGFCCVFANGFIIWFSGRILMRQSKLITETVAKAIPQDVSFKNLFVLSCT